MSNTSYATERYSLGSSECFHTSDTIELKFVVQMWRLLLIHYLESEKSDLERFILILSNIHACWTILQYHLSHALLLEPCQ